MVTVIDYTYRENAEGKEFITLTIQGGLEMIKSKTTGRFYATMRTVSIPSTLDEEAAEKAVGQSLPGFIQKVPCDPYERTNSETGEVVEFNYRYEYVPTEPSPIDVQQKKVHPSMNGATSHV
ncbi:hypothetical protein N9157_01990 [Saprospiraceae bacterium]|nr:hypothetical protein [Saprospiraceae bacterium]